MGLPTVPGASIVIRPLELNLLCSDITRTDRNTALHYTRLVPAAKAGAAAILVGNPQCQAGRPVPRAAKGALMIRLAQTPIRRVAPWINLAADTALSGCCGLCAVATKIVVTQRSCFARLATSARTSIATPSR
jgi:hypothetical protein